MKYLLDLLASTVESGGMKLHATELVRAWIEDFPNDELVLHGPEWIKEEFAGLGYTLIVSRNENPLHRAYNQLVGTARIARKYHVDAVVSFSPIVTPFSGTGKTVAFQHDWRHKLNPHEFPLIQRSYRKLWELSARFASYNACISQKAVMETKQFSPHSRTFLCPNGRDHARRWDLSGVDRLNGTVVTYGHHNNKRPELMISALGELRRRGTLPNAMRLVVLGAKGEYQSSLIQLASEEDVLSSVEFPGFVTDAEYTKIVGSSSVVALVSTDEGFGLPAAEAEYLDVPAVVSSDSGMAEIFGDSVVVTEPRPDAVADALIVAWEDSKSRSPLRANPSVWTWGDAVSTLRAKVASI